MLPSQHVICLDQIFDYNHHPSITAKLSIADTRKFSLVPAFKFLK